MIEIGEGVRPEFWWELVSFITPFKALEAAELPSSWTEYSLDGEFSIGLGMIEIHRELIVKIEALG